MPVPDAAAAGWESLWWRADQRAAQALERGDAELAARLAENPQLRGSAAYRARDYATAAGAFAEGDDAVALYNRGNALAHQRRLEEALAAYDAALDRDPAMEDAAHNRALVEQLLREQPRHEPSRGEHAREPGDPGGPENGRRPEEDEAPLTGADEDARERGAESGDQSEGGRADERPGGEEEPAGLDPGERLDAAGEGTQEAEGTAGEPGGGEAGDDEAASSERQQALEQWLRRIPDDPGGLLRRKFQRDYLERRRTAGVTTPAEGW